MSLNIEKRECLRKNAVNASSFLAKQRDAAAVVAVAVAVVAVAVTVEIVSR